MFKLAASIYIYKAVTSSCGYNRATDRSQYWKHSKLLPAMLP